MYFSVINVSIPFSSAGTSILPLRERVSINAKASFTQSPTVYSSFRHGMTIVISGNFSISRDDMKALIVAHGGKNSGSISKKTTYLLAGEKPGPEKIRKAESLGVEMIDESAFLSMIGHDEVKAEQEETEPTLF